MHPDDDSGLLWNDEEVGIDWPLDDLGETFSYQTKDQNTKNIK